jgi:hypothetical protein
MYHSQQIPTITGNRTPLKKKFENLGDFQIFQNYYRRQLKFRTIIFMNIFFDKGEYH